MRLSENPEDCALLAEALRVQGLLASERDPATGRKALLRALEVARAQGVASLALRAAVTLARARDRDASDLARLRELADGFTGSFESADLRSARTRLAEGSP